LTLAWCCNGRGNRAEVSEGHAQGGHDEEYAMRSLRASCLLIDPAVACLPLPLRVCCPVLSRGWDERRAECGKEWWDRGKVPCTPLCVARTGVVQGRRTGVMHASRALHAPSMQACRMKEACRMFRLFVRQGGKRQGASWSTVWRVAKAARTDAYESSD
jgi:hypothetical protein